ncbi:AI-2E family transporter [Segetibacter sp.]|jgi:predicted PurR-regulated permease PerM|uniref:AI-2E family transporter n=1 Tax=Segetibacter sp. TaxID=2231182 RepID=UPI00261A3F15|nr:AI-2E family transporter [Segetibacter sp.]MCW3078658.1 family transporter [Segetibacter sp.]
MENTTGKQYSFPQKVWIVGFVFAFIVVMLLLIKATFNVWLLILAGSLIAVLFRGVSSLLQRKTKWKEKVTLPISIIGTLLIILLLFTLIGTKVQSQSQQLSQTLPATIQNAKNYLNKSSLGQKAIEKVSSPKAQEQAQKVAQSFFQTTFGVFGDIYIVLFLGIFFTVGSSEYKNGIVALVPKKQKEEASNVLDKTGENLKKWLKGQLFAMVVVFAFTAIGLAIIGVPLWLVLAIIAGILNFIPNFGPMIAMVPAVLVGLMESPAKAAFVAGLYILVQVAESNFITPMVQKKLLDTPPAMIIVAQLLMAALTGGWGIILAIPFFVIVMTFVQELYIKKQE